MRPTASVIFYFYFLNFNIFVLEKTCSETWSLFDWIIGKYVISKNHRDQTHRLYEKVTFCLSILSSRHQKASEGLSWSYYRCFDHICSLLKCLKIFRSTCNFLFFSPILCKFITIVFYIYECPYKSAKIHTCLLLHLVTFNAIFDSADAFTVVWLFSLIIYFMVISWSKANYRISIILLSQLKKGKRVFLQFNIYFWVWPDSFQKFYPTLFLYQLHYFSLLFLNLF